MRPRFAVVAVPAFLAVFLALPARADTLDRGVSWRTGSCREAILLAPTRYENVAPLVSERFRDDIVRAPLVDTAVLILTLNVCTGNEVVSYRGSFQADRAAEVIAGVVLLGPDSPDVFQFYTLASYIDWEILATGFNEIGIPTTYVLGLEFDLTARAIPGTRTLSVVVPAPGETITATGSVVEVNPPPLDAHATQFAVGPHGVVSVAHHGPQFGINPGATAVISTTDASGMIASAMGATSGRADGVLAEKGPGHHHTATLID